ncbi:hypothetical protein K7X08_021080 [Anisodus acutangulus]|uniref:DUF569 domain-containing protein n=1 Tax=Anisodus acutangulus TaxID=402998 RepID=A0A9Q1M2R6_9SOLA|nr:hypothetical protein K7X08_021080 [Anisodus acutangulus]
MVLFHKAKAVRLQSHHDKYLTADEDEESVTQDRNGALKNAKWVVEFVGKNNNVVRLNSCYGKYLTVSNQPFLLGMTGRKVLQTLPNRLDSSIEWEPIREAPALVNHSDSFASESSSPTTTTGSSKDFSFSRQESSDSLVNSPPKLGDVRLIYYHITDEFGETEEGTEGLCITFKGNGVDDLKNRLEEETGLEEIIVCTRSPLNGKLYPLCLQLPPNNANMNVIILPASCKEASTFGIPRMPL